MKEVIQKLKVSNPQADIFESTNPINLFLAGVGSGKTHLGGIISGRLTSTFPQAIGLIAANTHEQLTKATMVRVKEAWKTLGLVEVNERTGKGDYCVGKKPPKWFKKFIDFDDYGNIITFYWGATIFKSSLENYKALEGIEIGWAILDETKDTREEAVREVIIQRLRQQGIYADENGFTTDSSCESVNPLYILTSPAKVDWMNEWFEFDLFEEEILSKIYSRTDYFAKQYSNKFVTISSTYHNEHNLSNTYLSNLLINHTTRDGGLTESGKRLIYANPFVKAGGEFYSSFDRTRHVGKVEFVDNVPVHLTYDFNVAPYMTLTCWQILRIKRIIWVRCFAEYCLSNPNNSSEAVSLAFKRDYEKKLGHGIFFYGDPGGRKRDTRSRKNDYMIIQQVLRQYVNNFSNRVARRAPPVLARRDFANNCFDEKYEIRILLDENCKKTIADFEYVKEDVDGTKLKQMYKDTETGQSYEKYGHTSDAFDYLLCQVFKEIFTKNYE